MECAKFILAGEDKKALATMKNALVQSGHLFLGYTREQNGLLRHIRSLEPELLIMEVGSSFPTIRSILEVVDDELLCACILVLESRNEEVFEFLRQTRVITYVAKPVFDEVMLQIADISISNYQRILEYEEKVRKLNATLESRKLIEKAKWILVEQSSYTEGEAYEAIQRKSRENRIPMRQVAEAIILTRGG